MPAAALALLLPWVLAQPLYLRVEPGTSTGARAGSTLEDPAGGGALWVRPELGLSGRVFNARLDLLYGPYLFTDSAALGSGLRSGGLAHRGDASLELDAAPRTGLSAGLRIFQGPAALRPAPGRVTELVLPVTSWGGVDAHLGGRHELTRRTRLGLGGAFYSGGALSEDEQRHNPRYESSVLYGELAHDLGRNDLLTGRAEAVRNELREGPEAAARLGATWLHRFSPKMTLLLGAGAAGLLGQSGQGGQLMPVLTSRATLALPRRTRRLELEGGLELSPRQGLGGGREQLTALSELEARWIVREHLRFHGRLGAASAPASGERIASGALGAGAQLTPKLRLITDLAAHHRALPARVEPSAPWGWSAQVALSWRLRALPWRDR